MTADEFPCICPLDPADLLDGIPRAVVGCPAHRARYAAQQWAIKHFGCCDWHNRSCEPPGDLCCGDCTEASHDTFPIRHADGTACVLEVSR